MTEVIDPIKLRQLNEMDTPDKPLVISFREETKGFLIYKEVESFVTPQGTFVFIRPAESVKKGFFGTPQPDRYEKLFIETGMRKMLNANISCDGKKSYVVYLPVSKEVLFEKLGEAQILKDVFGKIIDHENKTDAMNGVMKTNEVANNEAIDTIARSKQAIMKEDVKRLTDQLGFIKEEGLMGKKPEPLPTKT